MFVPKVGLGPGSLSRIQRASVYGLCGGLGELIFTACASLVRGHRLRPHTSPLMLPIYALMQPLFEPLHGHLRRRVPPLGRAFIYGTGFHTVEYLSGLLYRRLLGQAPWDYSSARWQRSGLIRFDYFPIWAATGLAAERLHDFLTGVGSRRRISGQEAATGAPWSTGGRQRRSS
jgi:putative ABC transporter type IV